MNKKVINGIKRYYQLPNEITDEQIAKKLKGSFGEAVVNLNIAKENLIKAFAEGVPKIIKKHFKNIIRR